MTTTQRARGVTAAAATRRGTRDHNADGWAIHAYPVAELTAAAVVDGIGNSPEVAALSRLAAQVAARIGARRGRMAGLLAAAELYGDPGATDVEPDAVAVLVLAEPGENTRLAWIGDCRAWGFDGQRLRQYTSKRTNSTAWSTTTPTTLKPWPTPSPPPHGPARRGTGTTPPPWSFGTTADQRLLSPGASRLVTSAIACAEGWKYFRTFSGFLCRDFAISIGRLAPCSPRWARPECRYS